MRLRATVWVSLASFVCAVGCGAEPPPVIETVFDPCAPLVIDVDGDASSAQRASVRAGVAMWNDAAGASLSVDGPATTEHGAEDAPAVEPPRVPLRFDPAGTAFHGYYDDELGIVYINERMREDRARTITVAHELGHAFGLFHVDAADHASVMNEGNTTVGVTRADVAALVALWGSCG